MTLDILICSHDKGIVRIGDIFHAPQEGVRYIVSYQYSDERYLELIPQEVLSRHDVSFFKYKGQGLSANRNLALEKSTADLVLYADDDARLIDTTFSTIRETFAKHPEIDIACFQVSTYTGKMLKDYPIHSHILTDVPKSYAISTIEMAFRREKVQHVVRFDERFGLGTKFLTCGEEEIWLKDALRAGLRIHYFPTKIVETSMLLKRALIYIDAGVQRSLGAISYYNYGKKAWWHCFKFAVNSTRKGYCHFLPLMRHMIEGIRYMQRTQ